MNCLQIQVQEDQKSLLLEALDEIRETKFINFEVREVIPTTPCRSDQESEGRSIDEDGCSFEQANNAEIAEEIKDVDEDSELETPKEIADGLVKWLECNGVARSVFAKYIDRSKSHLTDLLKRPPPSLPNGSGKAVWIKMKEFLTDSTARQLFLDTLTKKPTSKGKRKADISANATSTSKRLKVKIKPKLTPAKLKKWQQAMLDEIFIQSSGKPDAETVRRICSTLLLNKRQVSSKA